jgi:hypothetical protein
MIAELKVGPQTLSDGAVSTGRASKDGPVVTQDAHGRYLEAAYRGNTFALCNTQATAFAAGIATAVATGLILSNPSTSSKNLSLLQFAYSQVGTTVAQVALAVYSVAVTTNTTSASPVSTFINKGGTTVATGSVNGAWAAAGTPILPVYSNVNSSLTSSSAVPVILDLGGSIVLAPNSAIAVVATAATTGISSFLWEETPV